jgi:hypothetical protein
MDSQQEQTSDINFNKEQLMELAQSGLSEINYTPTEEIHIERRLYAIQKVEEEAEQLQRQLDASVAFYEARIARSNMIKDIIKQQIMWFLEQKGMNKIATPNGTAFTTKRTKVAWPENDELLIEWTKTNCIEAIKTKISTTVDKKLLKEFITSTGKVPEGYIETEVKSLSIR